MSKYFITTQIVDNSRDPAEATIVARGSDTASGALAAILDSFELAGISKAEVDQALLDWKPRWPGPPKIAPTLMPIAPPPLKLPIEFSIGDRVNYADAEPGSDYASFNRDGRFVSAINMPSDASGEVAYQLVNKTGHKCNVVTASRIERALNVGDVVRYVDNHPYAWLTPADKPNCRRVIAKIDGDVAHLQDYRGGEAIVNDDARLEDLVRS